VTIFGQSAGSMSVMYHYLSPQSKGLFQGAIAQSAPATSCFLKVDKNPIYYARSVEQCFLLHELILIKKSKHFDKI